MNFISNQLFHHLSLVDPINLISREIVTQDLLLVDLCAPVPAPASMIDAIYPPCVIPALFKWFFFILVLNSYLSFVIF